MSKPGLIPPPPRVYAIVARKSPWAVVFRRGPSNWFHIFRWDLESGALEEGVWLHDVVYPRRCDISDDGRLLLFLMRATIDSPNNTYAGVLCLHTHQAKVHWEGDTYGRGYAFSTEIEIPADIKRTTIHVDGHPVLIEHKGNVYGNERRRDWVESEKFPAVLEASPEFMWGLPASLVKRNADGTILHLSDQGYRYRANTIEGLGPTFCLHFSDGQQLALADAVWADFDHRSRLLTATVTGLLRIQTIESDGLSTIVEHDLRGMRPRLSPRIDWKQSTELKHANYF